MIWCGVDYEKGHSNRDGRAPLGGPRNNNCNRCPFWLHHGAPKGIQPIWRWRYCAEQHNHPELEILSGRRSEDFHQRHADRRRVRWTTSVPAMPSGIWPTKAKTPAMPSGIWATGAVAGRRKPTLPERKLDPSVGFTTTPARATSRLRWATSASARATSRLRWATSAPAVSPARVWAGPVAAPKPTPGCFD